MKLLFVHVGGTIGMVQGAGGLVPRAGVVEQAVRHLAGTRDGAITIDILTLDPLIDSANASPDDWNRLAAAIADHHDDFDGFVVTHGTDTMAFTAAALCFALEGLRKPVVLTGAMLPFGEAGSDGPRNLYDAMMAAQTAPAGIWVQFAGQLLHGARVWKTHSHSFDAFAASHADAPPCRPGAPLFLHRYTPRAVALLPFAPGIAMEVFACAAARCDGIVLRCYGSGTAPDSDGLRDTLTIAERRGIPVLAVSQCAEGGISFGVYAASRILSEAGVVDGRDMTAEVAYTKLLHALSLGAELEAVRSALETPLCGELTGHERSVG